MNVLSTQLRDVALTSSHDWDLTSGTFKFTSGLDGVAQAIDFIIRTHRGEWFMDLKKGFPYFERPGVSADEAILGSKFNAQARAVAEYRKLILAVEGVASIVSIAATLTARTLNVTWTVAVSFDDVASTTVGGTTLIER